MNDVAYKRSFLEFELLIIAFTTNVKNSKESLVHQKLKLCKISYVEDLNSKSKINIKILIVYFCMTI